MTALNIAGLEISRIDDDVIDAQPIRGGDKRSVRAQRYAFGHSDGWRLIVADVKFPDGQRDIRCIEYDGPLPPALSRLIRGLRLGINSNEVARQYIELSQARLKSAENPSDSSAVKVTAAEFDEGAGCAAIKSLELSGATVNTREKLLEDASRRRGYLCATWPGDSAEVPLLAYAAARVLPLLNKATV